MEFFQNRLASGSIPGAQWLINPGSVGQPRDGDGRAAYALFHPESRDVFYRRVAYDYEVTRRKIAAARSARCAGIATGSGR